MAIFTEGLRTSECLVSESNGGRSREKIIIASGAGIVQPNTPVGKVTASGKYVPVAPAASDGSQTAVAVSLEYVDATSADQPTGALVRDCEVNGGELDFRSLTTNQITAVKAQLVAASIIVRDPVG
jgi:hypothetical protein